MTIFHELGHEHVDKSTCTSCRVMRRVNAGMHSISKMLLKEDSIPCLIMLANYH